MKEMWDERYAIRDYVYGTDPNQFFKQFIDDLTPGSIFLPGEGEGRNGVYAARLGWEVVAQDLSAVGRKKALALAAKNGVSMAYHLGNILDFRISPGKFDLVAIIFLHMASPQREQFHRQMVELLKPGGYLLMEAFESKQINYGTGGPPNADFLYQLKDIRTDFQALETLKAIEDTIILDSNLAHKGEGRVIQYIGKKVSS